MDPRRSLIVVLALLAVVIAACGSSAPGETALAPATADAPTDAPTAEPTDEPTESTEPSEGGSDLPTTGRIEFPDKGYAITLPDNWFRVDLSDEGVQEMLQAGAGELPEGFDETMQAQIQQMLQSGVSLLAYRLPDDDASMGTNINVLVLPDYGMTLDTLEALNKAQIQQIVGANAEVGASRVDLAAGEAALLEYGFESGDGSDPVGIDQYYLVGDDNQLILTCTVAGGGDVGDECEEIADSLEVAAVTFDPTAELAPAPTPWASTSQPSHRDGPPYHMTEMIAAEPGVARRIVDRLADPQGGAGRLAGAVGQAASSGATIVVTGCGTSEHAAQATVEILREAIRAAGMGGGAGSVVSAQALELALDPPSGGLVIGVSHEGGTPATNRALAASAAAGARTGVLTASTHSPAGELAEIVVETVELDHSWCHTLGYLSPIVAAAAVGAHLSGRPLDADDVAALLAAGVRDETGAEAIAARLADARTLLVLGSGADRPAARELVLKVEEASWLPSAMRDVETFLHGHLPSTDDGTGLVLILADRAARADRLVRGREALAAAAVLGVRAAAIVAAEASSEIPDDLTPAGRLIVEEAPSMPAPVAALLGTATPLQLLTERLARARGTNPDPIRRDDERYAAASAAAEPA